MSSLALNPLWIPFSTVKVAEEFLYFTLKLMTGKSTFCFSSTLLSDTESIRKEKKKLIQALNTKTQILKQHDTGILGIIQPYIKFLNRGEHYKSICLALRFLFFGGFLSSEDWCRCSRSNILLQSLYRQPETYLSLHF